MLVYHYAVDWLAGQFPEYLISWWLGYDYWGRRKQIDTWLANFNQNTIVDMQNNILII